MKRHKVKPIFLLLLGPWAALLFHLIPSSYISPMAREVQENIFTLAAFLSVWSLMFLREKWPLDILLAQFALLFCLLPFHPNSFMSIGIVSLSLCHAFFVQRLSFRFFSSAFAAYFLLSLDVLWQFYVRLGVAPDFIPPLSGLGLMIAPSRFHPVSFTLIGIPVMTEVFFAFRNKELLAGAAQKA
ncbi:MAG: hypothetical protein HQL32_03535 [Planctomycetes bacterium]|nr:hypothetical protein [Planctomycetota bacterium]